MTGISKKLLFIFPVLLTQLSCASPGEKIYMLKNISGRKLPKWEWVIIPKDRDGFVVLNNKTSGLEGEVFVLKEWCGKNKMCIVRFRGTASRVAKVNISP
jgi:hypothetical protein